MLRTELVDLERRGFWVELVGSSGVWCCWIKNLSNFTKVSGRGPTPEEAVSAAAEQLEYRSDVQEIR